MAITLDDGILVVTADDWEDRYIQNDEGDTTFSVLYDEDEDKLYFEEVDEPEKNPALTDLTTHAQHYMKISKGVLYLTGEVASTDGNVFQCLCDKLDELIAATKDGGKSPFIAVS